MTVQPVFALDLVENPYDRFSCDEAQMFSIFFLPVCKFKVGATCHKHMNITGTITAVYQFVFFLRHFDSGGHMTCHSLVHDFRL